MVTDAALAALNGVSADNFGTTTVDLPGDNKPVVRDMQYSVGDGVGYTPIPVEDNNPAGNAIMDAFLRKEMGLQAQDQIWSMIVYLHPEEHTGTIKQLATEFVKTEGGQTHLG